MQHPSPTLHQHLNQPCQQIKKKHRSSNNKVAKFFRSLFSNPAAAAATTSASAGTTPIGGGGSVSQPPPKQQKTLKQRHQRHSGVWQCQPGFLSGESGALLPPSWLIEVSLPFGQQQAHRAAAPASPKVPPTPQPPQQRKCLRTLEQLQTRTCLKSQFLTPSSSSCQPQRQVATSSSLTSSSSQPQSTPIQPSAAKPSPSGFSNPGATAGATAANKAIKAIPVRHRTSLREIATDRAALDKCRKCPAVVKVSRTSSHLRVAPTPRTLWLHLETLKPLSPMPASATASHSLTPSPSPSLPPTKSAGSAPTTALTTLPTPPPPQLAKQRPPATAVQAPPLPPLLISPPSSPAVSCCSSSTSLPPQLLRSCGAESPPPTATVVGRVAEAVRRLNSAAASTLQRIPQPRETPRGKLLAAAAAPASTSIENWARTSKPSTPLSRAAAPAPTSAAPQPRPSFSELLARFEDFDRRRRRRAAAAAAVAAEAAASVSAVIAVAAASATSGTSPMLPTTKAVTSAALQQEDQKEPANVDTADHHLVTSPMIEEAVDTDDASSCAAIGGRAAMRVIRLLALSLVTAVIGNLLMRLALAYKDDLYNS